MRVTMLALAEPSSPDKGIRHGGHERFHHGTWHRADSANLGTDMQHECADLGVHRRGIWGQQGMLSGLLVAVGVFCFGNGSELYPVHFFRGLLQICHQEHDKKE